MNQIISDPFDFAYLDHISGLEAECAVFEGTLFGSVLKKNNKGAHIISRKKKQNTYPTSWKCRLLDSLNPAHGNQQNKNGDGFSWFHGSTSDQRLPWVLLGAWMAVASSRSRALVRSETSAAPRCEAAEAWRRGLVGWVGWVGGVGLGGVGWWGWV